jgi:hypothetical protein
LTLTKANVTTISDPTDMIKGFERANILLPNNIKLGIKEALYSPKSRRNFLSFKNICANGYHIETIDEDKKKKKTFTLSHVFHVRSLYLKNYLFFLMEFIT